MKTRTRKPGAEGFCLCKDVYQSHKASFLNALYTLCVLILIVYKCQEKNAYIMLKTIANAAEVTSTLTFNRQFGPCSETTSGKTALPVKAG
jgi:hypothetical protein